MNQIVSFFLLVTVFGCALAQYGHGSYEHKYDYKLEPYDPHPQYKFEYGVNDPHTYDIHSQKEERDGDVVHGEYSLVEPDGTKRVVKYTADHKTGFNAVVHREHNVHPSHNAKASYEQKYEYKPKYEYKYEAPKYDDKPTYDYEAPKYEYKPKYEAPKYEYKPTYSYKSAYSTSKIYKPAPLYKYHETPKYKYEAPKYEVPKYESPKYEEHEHSYKPSYSSSSFSTYHHSPKY